jgi:hypothetical protein
MKIRRKKLRSRRICGLFATARDMSLELGQAVFDTAVEKLIGKLT